MSERKDIDAIVGATVKLEESLNKRISELEKIVQDRKEYDLYLAKGGLIEQMIIRYAELKEANIVRHNECSGVYDDLLSLKEVLQKDYQFKIEKLPDNELKAHYEGLLEKFDEDSGGEE